MTLEQALFAAVAALVATIAALAKVIHRQYVDHKALYADYKALAKERQRDGEMFLNALAARRRASSRPPAVDSEAPSEAPPPESEAPPTWLPSSERPTPRPGTKRNPRR